MGDCSSAKDDYDKVLEVSPPVVNQYIDNQNINNDRVVYTTTNNNNNVANHQIEFTNQQRRNINAHTTNFGSQNSSTSQRMKLGGFVDMLGCNIWSNAHGTALTALLQLANGNENGIISALAHNNRSNWISQNLDAFFQPGGLLDSLWSVSSEVLQQHLKGAQTLAQSFYNSHHSSQTSEEHEDIPDWAKSILQYFEALNNHQTSNHGAFNNGSPVCHLLQNLVNNKGEHYCVPQLWTCLVP